MSTDPYYFHRFHVTNVITEKKFKVDGQITLCFEQSLCSEVMHFFDLPMSYDNCSAVGEEAAFKGFSLLTLFPKTIFLNSNLYEYRF